MERTQIRVEEKEEKSKQTSGVADVPFLVNMKENELEDGWEVR